jgi:hypothetical protein
MFMLHLFAEFTRIIYVAHMIRSPFCYQEINDCVGDPGGGSEWGKE